MSITVVILAAGQGTRMKSLRPKVLHKLAGRSLLSHVFENSLKLKKVSANVIIHASKQKDLLKNHLAKEVNNYNLDNIIWLEQTQQLGTGHATKIAVDNFLKLNPDSEQILVLYGDVPLINLNDLNTLITTTNKDEVGLLTLKANNPYGLGRIIRDKDNKIVNIIEEKDASPEQKLISEVNTGIFLLPYPKVSVWLNNLKTNNNQKEYYLTDIIKKCVEASIKINSVTVFDQQSYMGVNNLYQLSQAERHYQILYAKTLQEEGVNIIDPNRIDIRGNLEAENNVSIDINCIFEGEVKIGKNCIIEANCILKNSTLAENIHIKANSVIEHAIIGDNCVIGPFARLRPDTKLEQNINIGNFVEVKKSQISSGTKINHLSYIGDATIGENVNIGAGTITCNYDGINKHQTMIGNNAFIGSNSSLVAPIIIGENSTIGAGSTISKNAPDNKLTLSRGKQTTIDSWQRKTDCKTEVI